MDTLHLQFRMQALEDKIAELISEYVEETKLIPTIIISKEANNSISTCSPHKEILIIKVKQEL